jgi:hypothetical protein
LNASWELFVLHDLPSAVYDRPKLSGLAVGDLDGDGQVELIVGGRGALFWYRPATFERGTIAEGQFYPGLALEDVDGDGRVEVVTGCAHPSTSIWTITWFKPGSNLYRPWARYVLDPACNGGAHDLVFVDLDGDGERELVANATYCDIPGTFVYKRKGDPALPWHKHEILTRTFEDGLAAGDIDGDGRIEIVQGPACYSCPPGGPYSGPWIRTVYAPSFREMCRAALIDITGNRRPDVVTAEAEYDDGRLSWFENRLLEDPEHPWIEHPLERTLAYAHSLAAWHDPGSNEARVFVAEMARGGWSRAYNWDARLIQYATADQGATWQREVIYRGAGTHEATAFDVDGDGAIELVGKENPKPKVQIWKRRASPSPLTCFRHRLLDRNKPGPAIEVLATDLDGDGRLDVVCGSWWYKNPTWERHDIPGVAQVLDATDLDGDGRQELIAIQGRLMPAGWRDSLTSELCWLKAIDSAKGWELSPIGVGVGDWPGGVVVAPLLPGGKLALVASYHSASEGAGHYPEIFEVPDDPQDTPWPNRVLAEIPYGEQIIACDLDGDGKLDLVAGAHWLENLGDGTFCPRLFAEGFAAARAGIADINGNGRLDVVLGEGILGDAGEEPPFSRLAWFEHPEDPRSGPWKMHVIDTLRCPHSLGISDLDGDGDVEIVCGEHDPSQPYRSRCRLYVYKKAEPYGRGWYRHVLDDRFEHYNGAKVFQVAPGRTGILSHGRADSRYVHLWESH